VKYSYIQPQRKTPVTPELKLLLTFFSITIFMLLSTYIFLIFKDYSFIQTQKDITQKKAQLDTTLKDMQNQIQHIDAQHLLAQKIYTQNSVLKDSISNLFDLVPERITLSEAQLLKNGLILYGTTPNKDVYNFMLQAPLRSIFHKTYTSFYPLSNGWYNFVSTNYMDKEEDILNED